MAGVKSAELLIQGPAGSRLGFVAALLSNILTNSCFDVGVEVQGVFSINKKLHKYDYNSISKFNGTLIGIKISTHLLDLHLHLVLEKNFKHMIPGF